MNDVTVSHVFCLAIEKVISVRIDEVWVNPHPVTVELSIFDQNASVRPGTPTNRQ